MKIHFEEINSLFIKENDKFPTVHFYDNLGAKCSVRLDKAEWVNNISGESPLDDKFYVEDLYRFLKTKPKDKDYGNAKNFWEYAKRSWNIAFPDKKILINNIPDYRKLKNKQQIEFEEGNV